MKWALSTLLILFVFESVSFSQDSCKFTLIVEAPGLADSSLLTVCGNDIQLANWNPAKISLRPIGNQQWAISKLFLCPFNLEYKVTQGSWDSEAVSAEGTPLPNFSLELQHDTVVHHKLFHWKAPGQRLEADTGASLKFYRDIQYPGLLPRDLAVWLPPDYEHEPEKSYPVLYMHDGQNMFDPALSSFGVDWAIDEAADSLIKNHLIEEIIIVAIYNTPDRSEEYWISEKGDLYGKLLVDVIKHLIDEKYRTLPDPRNTAVGGSSAGALSAFKQAWENPDVFSKAICFSSAFIVDFDSLKMDYVQEVLKTKQVNNNLKTYIWHGALGLDSILLPGVNSMIVALESRGFNQGKNLLWKIDEKGEHSEVFWRREISDALLWMYGKYE